MGGSTTELTAAPPQDDVDALTELLATAAEAYKRPDVGERVTLLREHLREVGLRVLVIGDFKQGKSTFVNALLGERVCPVDDVASNALPMVIRAGETDRFEQDERDTAIEVRVPKWLLAAGFVLVDAPGTGGIGATGAAALANLPWADVVIFVTSATRELTSSELELLHAITKTCPRVIVAVTRIDLVPQWRKVVMINRGHLERAGFSGWIVPVSAPLRFEAIAANDAELNVLSGFPAVVDHLRESFNRGDSSRRTDLAVHEMRWLLDQLAGPFLAEQAELTGTPVASPPQIEEARGRAAKWQQTLVDSFTDLHAEADYDLRRRIRAVLQAADEQVDATDPNESWDDLVSAVTSASLAHVAEHHQMLADRVEEVATKIAAHFDDPDLGVGRLEAAKTVSQELARPQADNRKLSSAALTMMRGGYGGVAMFAMLGSMAGLTMAMPVVAAAGLFMGRRALADERQRSLAARKQQAKAAVRRYLDDVSVDVNKETRDSLREAQRQLRDAAAARHEAFLHSLAATAAAASRAAETDAQERARRLADVRAELHRLALVRARVDALVT